MLQIPFTTILKSGFQGEALFGSLMVSPEQVLTLSFMFFVYSRQIKQMGNNILSQRTQYNWKYWPHVATHVYCCCRQQVLKHDRMEDGVPKRTSPFLTSTPSILLRSLHGLPFSLLYELLVIFKTLGSLVNPFRSASTEGVTQRCSSEVPNTLNNTYLFAHVFSTRL